MNMSYCRFHNTLLAMQDCFSAMEDQLEEFEYPAEAEKISRAEFDARNKLIKLAGEMAAWVNDTGFADVIESDSAEAKA